MFNMKNEKILKMIGIVWLILWASYIPRLVYYYPFQELKGVKSLIEEFDKAPDFIKKESGLGDKNQKELEALAMKALRIGWVRSASIVLMGVLVAFLMLKKEKWGCVLALFISGGMLLLEIISFFKYWRHKSSPKYWVLFFKYFPAQTIQNIATIIVFITTIILLASFLYSQIRHPKS